MLSSDGVNWTEVENQNFGLIRDIIWNGSVFVAGGYNNLMISEDGMKWDALVIDAAGDNNEFKVTNVNDSIIITYGGRVYGKSNTLLISKDAVNWSLITLPTELGQNFTGLSTYDNKLIIYGRNSLIVEMTDKGNNMFGSSN
jgi:hypothetical protein